MPAHVPQSHHGSFHSMSPVSSVQHWQNQEVVIADKGLSLIQFHTSHIFQFVSSSFLSLLSRFFLNSQAASEASQISTHDQYQPPQTEQNHSRPDTNYDYEMSVNGQAIRPVYLDGHINQRMEPGSVIPTSTEEQVFIAENLTIDGALMFSTQPITILLHIYYLFISCFQVLETNDKRYLLSPQPEQSLEQVSYQFHGSLQLGPLEQNSEDKVCCCCCMFSSLHIGYLDPFFPH